MMVTRVWNFHKYVLLPAMHYFQTEIIHSLLCTHCLRIIQVGGKGEAVDGPEFH